MKIKAVHFFLFVVFTVKIKAQLLGSLGFSGSVNTSPASVVDNRTVAILRAILTTPFTKAGFFRKLSLLQMLNMGNGSDNAGGIGFNKGFLFGGSGSSSVSSITTEAPNDISKTPFPETVFRPSLDSDSSQKDVEINVSGSVSVDSQTNGVDENQTVGVFIDKDKDKNNGSSITRNRFAGEGDEVKAEFKSDNNSEMQGNGNQSAVIKVQGRLDSISSGRIRGNVPSAVALSSEASSSSSTTVTGGYQYFPAGPDRLTIPTNFQSLNSRNNRRISNIRGRKRYASFDQFTNFSRDINKENDIFQGKPFTYTKLETNLTQSVLTSLNNNTNVNRLPTTSIKKLNFNEKVKEEVQKFRNLTSPEEVNNLKYKK